jgi:hypothetical protein
MIDVGRGYYGYVTNFEGKAGVWYDCSVPVPGKKAKVCSMIGCREAFVPINLDYAQKVCDLVGVE